MEYAYEQYIADLDYLLTLDEEVLSESITDVLKGVGRKVSKIISFVKNTVSDIIEDNKLSVKEIVRAFKDRSIFGVLKAFGFSVLRMIKSIEKVSGLLSQGIIGVFREIHKTRLLNKIKSGAIAIDEVLDKYPILKKLTGPLIAGILLYTWLNMSFIGNFEYDMNISAMFAALAGTFSVEELFASPQGNAMLALLATGILSGGALSVAWMGSTTANMAAAITYVALKKVKNNKAAEALKRKMFGSLNEKNIISFKDYILYEGSH